MPTPHHIRFIDMHRSFIQEPILIIGSKIYDYDAESIQGCLKDWGYQNILGVDISPGKGVDVTLDITDSQSDFLEKYAGCFKTIFCLEILTNVKQPFQAAINVNRILAHGGSLFLAECAVRKISRMPEDFWRFTYDGLKMLFPAVFFNDALARMFYTRLKENSPLIPYQGQLPEIRKDIKHEDESYVGFWMRRIHRKVFSKGVFNVSRFLPEVTICALGIKQTAPLKESLK